MTPAAKANDWSKWGIISVDTEEEMPFSTASGCKLGPDLQSPIFSRVKGKWHTKYGLDEISITARESA